MDDDVTFTQRVFTMPRPKPASLIDQLLAPAAKPAVSPVQAPAPAATPPATEESSGPPKKSDPLPRPGDAYRACAQYLNRLGERELMIDFVDKHCYSVGFSYSDLRQTAWEAPAKPGGSPVLMIRFTDPAVTEVRLHGWNLSDIRAYIRQHLLPWVWEQPSGFRPRDDRGTVITAICITHPEL